MLRSPRTRTAGAFATVLMFGLAGCHFEGDGSVNATMQCETPEQEKQIVQAVFPGDGDSVTLTIGDEPARTLMLNDTSQGAQYIDGDLIFWANAPGTGFIAEGDTVKLRNCQLLEDNLAEGDVTDLF